MSGEEVVEIHDYDPAWVTKFDLEAQAISNLLGRDLVRIHHVGSTSVVGLGAKPIIDICIESEFYPPCEAIIGKMQTLGYQHMGKGSVAGRHWFKKGSPRSHHVHWCPVGGKVVQSQILFRDTLRNNPQLAKEYEAHKRVLAGKYGIDRLEYVKAKEPIITKILQHGCA